VVIWPAGMLDLIGLSGIEGWPHPDMRCRHDDLPQTWYLPSNAGWEYSEGTKTPWVGALLAGGPKFPLFLRITSRRFHVYQSTGL